MAKQNMGLTLNQEIFIGITFIVIIIIMILVKDKIMAILIVGLVANFLAISSQLIIINDRHLRNQSEKNGFENAIDPHTDTLDPPTVIPRDPLVIDQFNNKYDLYRDSCNTRDIPRDVAISGVYDSYEGKIDILPSKNMLSKIIDKNNIGYDADARSVREKIIRDDNDRVNPVSSTRKLIHKYIIPEVIDEEKKPWWG
jgi:hypothetical protein